MLGHHLNRGLENPNLVGVYMAVGDVARAKAFAESADLRQRMAESGVIGRPHVVPDDAGSRTHRVGRELPAMLISHTVADFDTWLAGYKAAATIQKQGGIIGDAVNRSLDDPKTVIVYHQAETHDALKSFIASPGLKAAMEKAGVTSVPRVSFFTGG